MVINISHASMSIVFSRYYGSVGHLNTRSFRFDITTTCMHAPTTPAVAATGIRVIVREGFTPSSLRAVDGKIVQEAKKKK